jgi:hypothetical protein
MLAGDCAGELNQAELRARSQLKPGKSRCLLATRLPESVNLYEAPLRGFYRVVASVFWGGLIQVLAGISGGSGGLLTKRSGWAA